MTEREGLFTIPTRLYLTAEERAKLNQLLRDKQIELGELVSQIMTDYLASLPMPASQRSVQPDYRLDLRKRRAELARLQAQREASGKSGPSWLNSYIAELEAEIQSIERQQRGNVTG